MPMSHFVRRIGWNLFLSLCVHPGRHTRMTFGGEGGGGGGLGEGEFFSSITK